MKKLLLAVILALPVSAFCAEQAKVLVGTYSGIINPVSAEYMGQVITRANDGHYTLAVLRLDTPGGLDLAMRDITKSILASKVPVVVYVSPSGARAASAGVFITMASQVAAMAPGTNIGAAHPVMIGVSSMGKKDKDEGKDPMDAKVLNDASAYIHSIAQQRGRNVDWAMKAVKESSSITADEAVKMKVVDLIAPDMDSLMTQLDGREIAGFGKLELKSPKIEYYEPSHRQKFLAAISDPNIAMILMTLGAAGLLIELYSPGLILPGVVGAISLILAFYSFQTLSANFAGLALILAGLIFFIAEIKVVSYGLLTVGGVVSIVMGTMMLFNTPGNMGLSVSYSVLGSTLLGLVLIVAFMTFVVVKAFKHKIVTGVESLIGAKGCAKTAIEATGTVFVEGELWDAVSASGLINEGDAVEIVKVDGYKLTVKKL